MSQDRHETVHDKVGQVPEKLEASVEPPPPKARWTLTQRWPVPGCSGPKRNSSEPGSVDRPRKAKPLESKIIEEMPS